MTENTNKKTLRRSKFQKDDLNPRKCSPIQRPMNGKALDTDIATKDNVCYAGTTFQQYGLNPT